VANLIAIKSVAVVRSAGALKGKITIAEDFDACLPDEIASAFEGR